MTLVVIGPWSVDPEDPEAQLIAKRVTNNHLDPRILALFKPGEVLLQTTKHYNSLPEWAWGGTVGPRRKEPFYRNYVDAQNAFVDELYSGSHELGHVFFDLFGNQAMIDAVTPLFLNVDEDQGWNEGIYTNHGCTVLDEGFADSFAKCQDNRDRFAAVLPRFYKCRAATGNLGLFLEAILDTAKRK